MQVASLLLMQAEDKTLKCIAIAPPSSYYSRSYQVNVMK